jgi:alkylated DNA repair protein alkB family protein 8
VQALLAAVDSGEWELLARRRVQHYGHAFNYTARAVDRGRSAAALPAAMRPVLARVLAAAGMPVADQLTVNEYAAGVGLLAHVDTHSAFGCAMASLSLAGPAVMEFRRGRAPALARLLDARGHRLPLPPQRAGEAPHAAAMPHSCVLDLA